MKEIIIIILLGLLVWGLMFIVYISINFLMSTRYKKISYELRKKIKRGEDITIRPTMRCNLDCVYCSAAIPTGKMPRFPEKTADQWIDYLDNFPLKIREITFSGGEPFIYKEISELINGLLEKGYSIRILTNLTHFPKVIKKSNRLMIRASYHKTEMTEKQKQRFKQTYYANKDKYLIKIVEYGQKEFPEAHIRTMFKHKSDMSNKNAIAIAPDFQVFHSCVSLFEAEQQNQLYNTWLKTK